MLSIYSWPDIAGRITSPISLAAYAMAASLALVAVVMRSQGKRGPAVWWLASGFLLLALILNVAHSSRPPYLIRVTVIGAEGVPTDKSEAWSSLGGERKRLVGGWEFELSGDQVPADGDLVLFVQAANLKAAEHVHLAEDHRPSIIIDARPKITVDNSGDSLAGSKPEIGDSSRAKGGAEKLPPERKATMTSERSASRKVLAANSQPASGSQMQGGQPDPRPTPVQTSVDVTAVSQLDAGMSPARRDQHANSSMLPLDIQGLENLGSSAQLNLPPAADLSAMRGLAVQPIRVFIETVREGDDAKRLFKLVEETCVSTPPYVLEHNRDSADAHLSCKACSTGPSITVGLFSQATGQLLTALPINRLTGNAGMVLDVDKARSRICGDLQRSSDDIHTLLQRR